MPYTALMEAGARGSGQEVGYQGVLLRGAAAKTTIEPTLPLPSIAPNRLFYFGPTSLRNFLQFSETTISELRHMPFYMALVVAVESRTQPNGQHLSFSGPCGYQTRG